MWITSGAPAHFHSARLWMWFPRQMLGAPELRGIAVRRQSQCQEISTCPVPTEVLSAQIVEARMMYVSAGGGGGEDSSGCGLRVRSYHIMITPLARAQIIPIVPLLGTAHADSHSGNCDLLDVCLICCYSSWLAITGQRGRVAPRSLMSLLRGSSGKIISDKHLDHLFTPANSPQLDPGSGPFRWKRWRCQLVSLRRNTNATRSTLCELVWKCEMLDKLRMPGGLWLLLVMGVLTTSGLEHSWQSVTGSHLCTT